MNARKNNTGAPCGAHCVSECMGTAHPSRPLAVAYSARDESAPELRRYAGAIVCSACAEALQAAGLTVGHAHRCRADGCDALTAGSLCDVHFASQKKNGHGHGKNGHGGHAHYGQPDVSPVLVAYKAAIKVQKAEARLVWELEHGWVDEPEPAAPTPTTAGQRARDALAVALAMAEDTRGDRAPGLVFTRPALCSFCGRHGHDRAQCPDKGGPRGKKGGEKDEKKNGAEKRHPGKQKNHA